VPGRVRVRLEVPFRLNRDIDNIKPLLDLAASLKLIEDDNRVDELLIVRVPAGQATIVSIWQMETT
jgi:Holliday junction resolvase RusA-like endonuclease